MNVLADDGRHAGERVEDRRRVVLAARPRAWNPPVVDQQVRVFAMLAHVVAGAARILVRVPARDERESRNQCGRADARTQVPAAGRGSG